MDAVHCILFSETHYLVHELYKHLSFYFKVTLNKAYITKKLTRSYLRGLNLGGANIITSVAF